MSGNYWKVVLDGVSLRGTQSKKLDAKKYHEELGKKKMFRNFRKMVFKWRDAWHFGNWESDN